MNSIKLQEAFLRIDILKQQGFSNDEILQRLLETGLSNDVAQQQFNEWKKIRNEKKRNSAFVYCGIGIFLLTTGFFFTLMLFNSNSNFNFALYGLTIIGLVLVFKGMIDLMS
ncbi:hypothetical protein ESA94_02070 [Lacibacter luteus]|uniref:DUF2157 domain-containing protein n=1 Tax=Lacibacter luteus TaxID=2508719 RepID=A0A4Q1CLE7_9BACT|nr:hypothetical protein [Lacibacter luteus]RXK61823.1 hypothetical protein ESA94_02070 [Lacibacter luteus]